MDGGGGGDHDWLEDTTDGGLFADKVNNVSAINQTIDE